MTDKKITDEKIKSSFEVIATTRNCNECKIRNCKWGTCNCSQITANAALDLINRQQAEIERLNEHYKNLAKASVRHAFDTENDRQLLYEYQNIFLELGYGLREVQDLKLKEIKSWKDRAIWHIKRVDQLGEELKTAKSEAIKEFVERLKSSIYIDTNLLVYECKEVKSLIDDIVKEMVGDNK